MAQEARLKIEWLTTALECEACGIQFEIDRGKLACPSLTVAEAFGRYGTPEIFNTDQGSQFTSLEFTELLKEKGVAISMDGKGCWRDNVFVERLWRSIKYEEVYLHAYDSVSDARKGLERYLAFYNHVRPHSMLDDLTPDEVYFGRRECLPDAA